jgi:hypothetical protein
MTHRWVRHADALDYVMLGWVPLPTLNGTTHGHWSVHVVWMCRCREPVEPRRVA